MTTTADTLEAYLAEVRRILRDKHRVTLGAGDNQAIQGYYEAGYTATEAALEYLNEVGL